MRKERSTILERLMEQSFPIAHLYEAKKNQYIAPLSELILASEQIAAKAQESWEFKSLAEIGREQFILTGNLDAHDRWTDAAQKVLATEVCRYIYYEENEGLLFFVKGENGKFRVARPGDHSYDFVRRLNAEGAVSDLRFTKPPTWAYELFLGYENLDAFELAFYDNSSLSTPRYQASKKLLADAVIRETWRRMGIIPGLARNAGVVDAVSDISLGQDVDGALTERARPLPRSRLVSIVGILKAIARISEGTLTVAELADAIHSRAYDGDTMMLYRGGGYGLAEPITGNPLDENSGYNERVGIVCELFNVRFWDDPKATISHTDARDFLVLRKDGVEIARRLWKFFYPNRELAIDESNLDDCLNDADAAQREEMPGYSTPLLAVLNAAIAKFFEPRHTVDAKKDEVVEWIKKQMIAAGMADSENIATAIFTIIKPENHDPRKRRG